MKKLLLFSLAFSTFAILSGCSRNQVKQEEETIVQEVTQDTGALQVFDGWNLSGTYIVEPVSGDKTTTYNGELFTTVKITDITNKKWTYFTSYPGQWSDFELAREANMFSGQTAPTITNKLAEQAFDTQTGGDTTTWYHVQVPIDWTLLVHQGKHMVFVLDFDDPSGTWNKMSYKDIQKLIQHIQFTQ